MVKEKDESVGLKGYTTFRHKDSEDNEIESFGQYNTITEQGLAVTAGLLADVSGSSTDSTPFSHIGIGISGAASTSAQASNTALDNEIYRSAGASSIQTQSVTDDEAQWQTTFTFSGAQKIRESGVFNAAGVDSGNILCRQTFGDISVASADSLEITWQVYAS